MTAIIEIPETLTAQQAALTSKLTELDAQQASITEERKGVEASLLQINTAICYLKGEPIPVAAKSATLSGRKPMSPEARENIRQGLLASAARKKEAAAAAKVAAAAPTAPETAPVPVAAPVIPADAPKGRKAAAK